MADLPEFHNFREMCEHVADGGAAYRYGSYYPLYCPSWYGIETRFDGGSSGEMCKQGAQFTVEEQNSTNWVFISKEDWLFKEEQSRKAWREIMDRRIERKREQEKLVLSSDQSELVESASKPWWEWWK